MKSVIKSVIQPDQTAYVPGRYIGESVRLISDILEYTDDHSLPGFLVTADIEKAFDSIEHPFIVASLKKLGFGPTFCAEARRAEALLVEYRGKIF